MEATVNAADVDAVVIATPIDLRRIMKIKKPCVRVRYELQEMSIFIITASSRFWTVPAGLPSMVEKAVEVQMPALALTDHGNLFGQSNSIRGAARQEWCRSSAARPMSRRGAVR